MLEQVFEMMQQRSVLRAGQVIMISYRNIDWARPGQIRDTEPEGARTPGLKSGRYNG